MEQPKEMETTKETENTRPALRPYQENLRDELTTVCAQGKRRILCQSWMGSGKTVLAARIAVDAALNGKRVLWLVHRRELVFQAVCAISAAGLTPSTMISGDPYDKTIPIVVASVQTLHSWCVRRKKEPHPQADLIIQDECHHVTAKTYIDIHNLYPEAISIGLTATPISNGGQGLAAHYDAIVHGPSIKELQENGYLVSMRYVVPALPDLNKLKVSGGDYARGETEKAMDRPDLIGDIVANWIKFGDDRSTFVFASGVSHSRNIVDKFNQIGISASHVCAGTPNEERDKALSDFKSGKIKILSNVGIYTEGTDIPSAACLIFARPTLSECLYLQVGGRVMRPFPGKPDAILLDHAGVVYQHGRIEMERKFSLSYNVPKVKKLKEQAKKRKNLSIVCKNCKTYYEPKERKSMVCPSCGAIPLMAGRPMQSVEAWLTNLDSYDIDVSFNKKKQVYTALIMTAKKRRYKIGWAAHQFKAKFGSFPPWSWSQEAQKEFLVSSPRA